MIKDSKSSSSVLIHVISLLYTVIQYIFSSKVLAPNLGGTKSKIDLNNEGLSGEVHLTQLAMQARIKTLRKESCGNYDAFLRKINLTLEKLIQ
jgi:hypothetical protein